MVSEEEPFQLNIESPETLSLSLELGDEPGSMEALERILNEVVRAAGGHAGVLTTMDQGQARTSRYGQDTDKARVIEPLIEQAVAELTEMGETSTDLSLRLEQEAGEGIALTFPVRHGERSVGLFCVLTGEQQGEFLRDSPGLVHLMVDKLELTIANARLLHRLLSERRWLEAVIQHSSDGVVILDREGLVVGYNITMAGLTGWAIGEAAGKPCHEAFPLRIENRPKESTSLVRLGQRHFVDHTDTVEAVLLDRHGEALDVEVSGAPLFDERARPLGWVMSVRDISKRKEMERLQKVFLSAVSHELHTPIAIIKGFAGLIADPDVSLDMGVIREKAGIIVEESIRLERMVRQMLDATRIQAGGIKLAREPENIGGLVRRVVEKMRPVVAEAGCEIELEMGDEPPLAMIDSGKMQQVLTNLLENAAKYGGKQVKIRLSWDARKARLEVSDSGPGIPEAARDRIFEPFERGDGKLPRGAGLGLFISKSIIDAHGGTIKVEEGERGGARFLISIPLSHP